MPPEVTFATRPQQVAAMIARTVAAGVPFAWMAADEEFGQNPSLRAYLEGRQIAYCMAVPKTTSTMTGNISTAKKDPEVVGNITARCNPTTGHAVPAGSAPKASGSMTGRSSPPVIPGTSTWSAGTSPMVNWPTSTATTRAQKGCPNWSASSAPAGPSRNASKRPNKKPDSTNTSSVSTTPGTGTSPWPCSPFYLAVLRRSAKKGTHALWTTPAADGHIPDEPQQKTTNTTR